MANRFRIQDYNTLADFRLALREFFHFSELAAEQLGLTSQQYQTLLAIKAAPGSSLTIGSLARHMYLQPHSATGLVDRLVRLGVLQRSPQAEDRREVRVRLTSAGNRILASLASAHRSELRRLKPLLEDALARL